jgi:hypothetical protein
METVKHNTISDIMIYTMNPRNTLYTFESWCRAASEYISQYYPLNEKANDSKRENVLHRRVLINLALQRFGGEKNQTEYGIMIAYVTNRKLPYDHASIFHARKKHEEAFSLPNAYKEYIANYKRLESEFRKNYLL